MALRSVSGGTTGTAATTLAALADVSAPSPTAGQSLVWNGSHWVPTTLTTTGAAIADITASDYAGIRAYTGASKDIAITVSATAGLRAGRFRNIGAVATTYPDDGGICLVDASGNCWIREFTGPVNVGWFKLDTDTYWSNAFDAATAALSKYYCPSRTIQLPGTTMAINRPWKIPESNAGLTIQGDGDNYLASHIDASAITSTYTGFAAIHQLNTDGAVVRALNLKDLRLGAGNAGVYGVHGVYLNQNADGVWQNVLIEAFKGGSGLICDSAQDYAFYHLDIQSCGGTVSNVYTDVTVISVSANTTYPPLNLTTTTSNTCNYLRFYDCEIEGNWVSPYVRIGTGTKWIYFTNGHSEHRGFFTNQQAQWGCLFENNGGEVFITGQGQSPEFTYGLNDAGGGRSWITACPDFKDITNTATGVNVDIRIHASAVGNIVLNSVGGSVDITGGSVYSFASNYPAYNGRFANFTVKTTVAITNGVAASSTAQTLDWCNVDVVGNWSSQGAIIKFRGGAIYGSAITMNGGLCSFDDVYTPNFTGMPTSLNRTSTYRPYGSQTYSQPGKPTASSYQYLVPLYVGQHFYDNSAKREWYCGGFATVGTPAYTDWIVQNNVTTSTSAPSTTPYAVGDVYIYTPTSGTPVIYTAVNTTSSAGWQAQTSGTSGSTTLAGLTDVAESSPASGQALIYNGTAWANSALPTTAIPSGTAAGDLSGTYPNPTVAQVSGLNLYATGTTGIMAQYSGATLMGQRIYSAFTDISNGTYLDIRATGVGTYVMGPGSNGTGTTGGTLGFLYNGSTVYSVTFTGITPGADNTWALGRATNRWNGLYVYGSVVLGSTTVTAAATVAVNSAYRTIVNSATAVTITLTSGTSSYPDVTKVISNVGAGTATVAYTGRAGASTRALAQDSAATFAWNQTLGYWTTE